MPLPSTVIAIGGAEVPLSSTVIALGKGRGACSPSLSFFLILTCDIHFTVWLVLIPFHGGSYIG